MQVRTIEFQENFRLVTLEATRQQSLLNRDPVIATQNAAGTLAAQRTQDLGRVLPREESDSPQVVEEHQADGGNLRRQRQSDQGSKGQPEDGSSKTGLPKGKRIDQLA